LKLLPQTKNIDVVLNQFGNKMRKRSGTARDYDFHQTLSHRREEICRAVISSTSVWKNRALTGKTEPCLEKQGLVWKKQSLDWKNRALTGKTEP
jgi:hypothetical protein